MLMYLNVELNKTAEYRSLHNIMPSICVYVCLYMHVQIYISVPI